MNAIETLRDYQRRIAVQAQMGDSGFDRTRELQSACDQALAKLETLLQAAERVVAPFALDRVSYEDYESLAAAVRDVKGES